MKQAKYTFTFFKIPKNNALLFQNTHSYIFFQNNTHLLFFQGRPKVEKPAHYSVHSAQETV